MIVIKRSCNSSIRNDPVQEKITFGAFTIMIGEIDYTAFDWLSRDLELKPADLLQEVILAGIDKMMESYEDPVVE